MQYQCSNNINYYRNRNELFSTTLYSLDTTILANQAVFLECEVLTNNSPVTVETIFLIALCSTSQNCEK